MTPSPSRAPTPTAAGGSSLLTRLRSPSRGRLPAPPTAPDDTLAALRLRHVRLLGVLTALTAALWACTTALLGLWPRAGFALAAMAFALVVCQLATRRPYAAALMLSALGVGSPLLDSALVGGLLYPIVWLAVFGVYAAGVTTGLRTTIGLGALAWATATMLLVRDLGAGAAPDLWLAYFVFLISTGLAGGAGRMVARLTAQSLDRLAARADALGGELTTSEARYRDLADRLPVGLFRSTADGRFLMANPAMADMMGVESPEVLCALGTLPFHRDAATRHAFVETMVRDGAVCGFLLDFQRLDGTHRVGRIDARVVSAPGSEPIYEGSAQDVTDEQRALRALAAAQARQMTVLDAVSDTVLVLTAGGRITFASPAVTALTGRSPAEVRGATLLDLTEPESRAVATERLRQAMAAPGTPTPIELTLAHADGHAILAEGVWSDKRPAGGRVVSFRDVTERKRAEVVLQQARERAEEGARLKNALLANVSHEIRTPLTAILGFSEILAAELGQSEHREFVDLIAESGERLMGTLSSVIDLAQLDAGRVRLDATPTRLAAAVVETTRALRAAAEARGLTFTVHAEAPRAEAGIDPDALDRVLRHVIGNAIKFTERGGVTVTVRAAAGRVLIDVADTGIGISEAFLPRLFEAFEQESAGSGRDFEGVGVGLAVSRRLVERMGGEIAIDSRKGAGTTVTVSFLRTDLAPTDRSPDARPLALVLDDNPQAKFVAERLLLERYRVRSARSAGDLLALADELAADGTPAALALLDIHLGTGPTGDDVMRALRTRPAYAEAPIVAVTAYALPGDRARFLAAGFDGYLTKPYTRPELFAVVNAAMTARRGAAAPVAAEPFGASPATPVPAPESSESPTAAAWVSRPPTPSPTAPPDPTTLAPAAESERA